MLKNQADQFEASRAPAYSLNAERESSETYESVDLELNVK
jgi:hypothetical protein